MGFASCVVCVCVSLLDSSSSTAVSASLWTDVHARVIQRAYDRPKKSLAVIGIPDLFYWCFVTNGEISAVFRVFARTCISSDSLGRETVLEWERYFQRLLYSRSQIV